MYRSASFSYTSLFGTVDIEAPNCSDILMLILAAFKTAILPKHPFGWRVKRSATVFLN